MDTDKIVQKYLQRMDRMAQKKELSGNSKAILNEFDRRLDQERPLGEGFAPNPSNMVPKPMENIIEEMGLEEVASGAESVLYDIHDQVLLKVSPYKTSIRGEYIIFRDPEFQDVTPVVYDHGKNWWWYAVERVDPLGFANWDRLMDFFPTLRDQDSQDKPKKMFMNTMLKRGDYRESWNNLSERERKWFEKIEKLHDLLDFYPHEVQPKNLGVDSEGNLVFLDILSA